MELIGEGRGRVLGLVIEDWNTDSDIVYLWAVLPEDVVTGSGLIVTSNITRHHARSTAACLRTLLSVVQGGEPVPIVECGYDDIGSVAVKIRREARADD